MGKRVITSKTSSVRSEKPLPADVKVVKSPLHEGIEQLSVSSTIRFVPISVILRNGVPITNTDQFHDEDSEEIESE